MFEVYNGYYQPKYLFATSISYHLIDSIVYSVLDLYIILDEKFTSMYDCSYSIINNRYYKCKNGLISTYIRSAWLKFNIILIFNQLEQKN